MKINFYNESQFSSPGLTDNANKKSFIFWMKYLVQ